MIRIVKQNKESVIRKVQNGSIDAIALSTSNIVDEIVLSMHKNGMTECLTNGFPDKRASSAVPLALTLLLAIAAKMKIHTSLTDIPCAITDHRSKRHIVDVFTTLLPIC